MSSFQLLSRLFKDQCTSVDDLENKGKKISHRKSPTMKSLRTLYRIRLTKIPDIAGTKARDYQVQVMETYSGGTDKKQLSLITHIKVEPADKHDANALLPALKNTDKRDMSPN